MTDTITRNSTPPVVLPGLLFVETYDGGLEVANILHPKMNAAGVNVTYRPTRDLDGTLSLLFATAADAWASVTILREPYNFTLAADETQVNMTFTLAPGRLKPRLDPASRTAWLLDVPFHEVTP